MKKILLVIFILVSAQSFAQEKKEKTTFINQGTYEVTGSVNFATTSSENASFESKNLTFGFIPQLGIAVSDDLVLGLGLGFSYSESENSNVFPQIESKNYSRSYSFRPYIKKYFSLSEKFALNLQGEVGYGFLNSSPENTELNSFNVGLRPGLNYRLNNNLALIAQIGFLGYSRSSIESNFSPESKSSTFSFDLNPSNLNFGVNYFF